MHDLTASFELLADQAVAFLPKLVVALVIFVVGVYLAGILSRGVHRLLVARRIDEELSILFRRIVKISGLVLATVVALQQVDFEVTAFVAGLGIVGFTIGFALQDVSKHLIAGVLLLLQQPFEIGDAIEVAGHAGVVTTINLRATELRTFDGLLVLIPNGDVYVKPIRKFTRSYHRRAELTIKVQTSDVVRARALLTESILAVEGVIQDSPSPRAFAQSLTPSTVELTCFFWVDLDQSRIPDAQVRVMVSVRDGFTAADLVVDRIAMAGATPDVFGGVSSVA